MTTTDYTGDLIVGALAIIGIGIGFLLNEYARRRHRIEDALIAAEGAVAGAAAAMHFISLIDTGFDPSTRGEVERDFQVHAATTARDALVDARKKLTEVSPYVPSLRKYLTDQPHDIVENQQAIIDLLSKSGRALIIRRPKTTTPSAGDART